MFRRPARFLAPIALAATIAATYLVVHKGLSNKHKTTTTPVTTRPGPRRPGKRHRPPPRQRFYVVRPGDSLSAIASKTGVPLSTLVSLNPNVNPSALQTGQRLRLRR